MMSEKHDGHVFSGSRLRKRNRYERRTKRGKGTQKLKEYVRGRWGGTLVYLQEDEGAEGI